MKKEFFSIEEVAQLTGLSKSTLYKLTANRVIPFFKPFGKKIYMSRDQINAMLTKTRIKSIDELKSEVQNDK